MKYINISLLAMIMVLFVSSCFKERIDINLNENNKKVVVTAWISDLDEPQFVNLSYTTNYLEANAVDPISNATVELANDNATYSLVELENGRYYLPNDWSGEIGQKHKLTIMIGDEEYTSEAVMNACPELQNLHVERDDEDDIGLVFDFMDIEGKGDGYFGIDYLKGSLRKDTLTNGSYFNDALLDGFLLGDVSFTDYEYNIGDTVIVDVFSIGLEATNYLEDVESEIFRGSLFDPPPVNIRTNISNGALGYFIISGARREVVIID